MGNARNAGFIAVAALLFVGVVEVCSALFAHFMADRFTWADPTQYAARASRVEYLKTRYDKDLGWQNPAKTPLGDRVRSIDHGRPLMATFGDSYVYCDDIKDIHTWQEKSSKILQLDVLNFGGSGYGTDQALIRFRKVGPHLKTPIVALGVTTENINRIVNRYRPFYYPRTAVTLTKPRFVLEAGQLRLMENPIASKEEVARLTDPSFMAVIGDGDHWYQESEFPERAFPHSRMLFSGAFWREAFQGHAGPQINDMQPRPWANLWSQPETRALMLAIIDAFVSEAKDAGKKPLLMIMPRRADLVRHLAGRPQPGRRILLEHCRAQGLVCFDGIAEMARGGHPRDLDFWYSGHMNKIGTERFAARLSAWLVKKRLAQPAESKPHTAPANEKR
jgi:hypothetical protein